MPTKRQKLTKQNLLAAMELSGFENWRPPADVPQLNRPISRPEELPGTGLVAAVMVLVVNNDTNTQVVLTKRNANLSKHASQISFPGGRQDAGETLAETALRETEEEIGVVAGQIELIGQLNPVYIPPSDFTVTPFVGWLDERPTFQRSEAEVEQIIMTSVATLMHPDTLVVGDIIRSSGASHRVPYYAIDEHKVWGATAIMVGEFVERLSRVDAGQ